MLLSKYFAESFVSMLDIETRSPNFLEWLLIFLIFGKDIKETKLYDKISKQADSIEYTYINSNSNDNLSEILRDGWNKLRDALQSGELLEDFDYYDSVGEFFEISVDTMGSLRAVFGELEQDLDELKEIVGRNKKILSGK